MRGRGWIVAAALVGLVGCGPPRQTSIHALAVDGRVLSLAFAPDGHTVACTLPDRILLVDAENGTRLRELGPLPAQYLLVAFSRGRLLSLGTDGYARLWDVPRGVAVDSFRTGEVRNLAISPDGRWLVTTPAHPQGYWRGEGEETITIWDLEHNRRSPPMAGSPYAVQSLAVSADGLVAVGRHYQKIDVFEAQTGKPLRTLRGEGPEYESVGALAFSPDAPHILAAVHSSIAIVLWDVVQGRMLTRFGAHLGGPLDFVTPSVRAMSFGMQGLLAAGGSHGAAKIWRVGERPEREPRAIAKLSDYSALRKLNDEAPEVSAGIDALAVNGDGSLIVTAHGNGKIRIWRGPGAR